MDITYYTNRPDLCQYLHASPNDFCLFDLGHDGPTSSISKFQSLAIWNSAKHIFLIDKEARPQMLNALLHDSRIHVWDSLVMPDHPRWHSYFWWWTAVVDLCKDKDLLKDLSDPMINPPTLLFDCLMGNIKKSHVWLYHHIPAYLSLQEKTILNFYGRGDPYVRATDYQWETYEKNNLFGSRITLRNGGWLPLSTLLPVNIYRNSWFSIITESFSDHTRYFSEKTAKPLLGKRLFILFAAPGMLQDLRTLGFQTFGTIIDESYDDIQDDESRWNLALKQVIWLSQQDPVQIYQKALPILEHNQNLMLSLNYPSTMLSEMQNILSDHK